VPRPVRLTQGSPLSAAPHLAPDPPATSNLAANEAKKYDTILLLKPEIFPDATNGPHFRGVSIEMAAAARDVRSTDLSPDEREVTEWGRIKRAGT
jgi:hypothetical protein